MVKSPPARVLIVAMLCITTLELMALYKGIDGIYFTIAAALLGGLAGLKLKDWFPKKP